MADHIEAPTSWESAPKLGSFGSEHQLNHLIDKHGDKILSGKDEYSCDPVTWAARNGRQNIVHLMIKKEADLESKSYGGLRPLHHAVNMNEVRG